MDVAITRVNRFDLLFSNSIFIQSPYILNLCNGTRKNYNVWSNVFIDFLSIIHTYIYIYFITFAWPRFQLFQRFLAIERPSRSLLHVYSRARVVRDVAREFPARCAHNVEEPCEKADGCVGTIMEMDLPSNKARNSGKGWFEVPAPAVKQEENEEEEEEGWWLAMGLFLSSNFSYSFIVRKKIEPALKTSGISNWKNAATMFVEKFFDRRNCRLENLESDVSSSMVARGHR